MEKAFFFLTGAYAGVRQGDIIAVGEHPDNASESWRVVSADSSTISGVTIARVKPGGDVVGKLQEAGLGEVAGTLEQSWRNFELGTGEGYSDCKNGCRKALCEAAQGLTGVKDEKAALKALTAQGIIGGNEEELMKAFDLLCNKLHGFAAKRGSHTGKPPREEAELCLAITDALLLYLVTKRLNPNETSS